MSRGAVRRSITDPAQKPAILSGVTALRGTIKTPVTGFQSFHPLLASKYLTCPSPGRHSIAIPRSTDSAGRSRNARSASCRRPIRHVHSRVASSVSQSPADGPIRFNTDWSSAWPTFGDSPFNLNVLLRTRSGAGGAAAWP
jgi:hypothetical protein